MMLVLGLVFYSESAVGQNLAANPGFEMGNTSGWLAFGSPTISVVMSPVHSGSYAASASNRSQTYEGIAQSFLGVMQPGQTYNISVWLQLASGSSQTMQVTAVQVDGNGTSYTDIASGLVSAGSWTQLTGQFTLNVSGALSELTIYFEMPSSTTTSYYIDDLSVTSEAANTNGQCAVDWNTVFQRIDGFGASSAWRSTWNSTQADMLFSTNASGTALSFDRTTNFFYTGIGLSLLRSRIAPGGTTVESSIMQMAQARGAKVWSTPWSPAANFKSNTNVNGGSIVGNTTNYQAYASQLAGYVAKMKSVYGVNLYAISVQNEPDANVTTYESCNWNSQQIHDFVPYLYNALVASNVPTTKIMLPESQNWQDYSNLAVKPMSDSTSNDVSIIACHNYDGTNGPSSLTKNNYGKALWETEVSLLAGSDSSIANGIYYAGRIHLFLTSAQANAWHYWWLIPGNSSGNEGLTDTNGVPAKRMYMLGQFSRFVRPNYYRIGANNTGTALISAYKDSGSQNFAIVAINSGSADITQVFNLTNITGVSGVTPWITTGSLSLTNQPAVTVLNSNFTYILPAMSIVTFVGQQIANQPPVFAVVNNQTINPGVMLVVTNVATDAPPQTVTYTLLHAPTNATLNPVTGVFDWRPLLSQANSTNFVSVQATDSGTPNLSATNSFKITVNPVVLPVMSANLALGGNLNIVMNGAQGPDYSLLVSSNLMSWHVLFTTNSPLLPVTFVETNMSNAPASFYRAQIGP
jgi:glucuronoarabinoxylan endo-1,4-beta-xylanase